MRAIPAVFLLCLVACGQPTEPDAGDACTRATCGSLGKDCGDLPDGCGGTLSCGTCESPLTCGGGGEEHVCGCRPETDQSFCERAGASCGEVTTFDNCGASRTVVCGSCAAPETCGGGGVPHACGLNRCPATCDHPPAPRCVDRSRGGLAVQSYTSPGHCDDPVAGTCTYDSALDNCNEDCVDGQCVQTACTLHGFECTTPRTGCKLATPTSLRCLPTGSSPVREGQSPCDDRIPEAMTDYLCGGGLRCVWPQNVTAPTCAYICQADADCANVGLFGHHRCVFTPDSTYGYCE